MPKALPATNVWRNGKKMSARPDSLAAIGRHTGYVYAEKEARLPSVYDVVCQKAPGPTYD